MSIPDQPLFEEFLRGCEIVKEQPRDSFHLFPPGSLDARGERGVPALYLRFPDTRLAVDSVLNVISKELAERGCAADRDIALSVVAPRAAVLSLPGLLSDLMRHILTYSSWSFRVSTSSYPSRGASPGFVKARCQQVTL